MFGALSTCVFYVIQKISFSLSKKKLFLSNMKRRRWLWCADISQRIYSVKYMRRRKKGREEKNHKMNLHFYDHCFLQLDITFRLLSSSLSLKNQQFPFFSCFNIILWRRKSTRDGHFFIYFFKLIWTLKSFMYHKSVLISSTITIKNLCDVKIFLIMALMTHELRNLLPFYIFLLASPFTLFPSPLVHIVARCRPSRTAHDTHNIEYNKLRAHMECNNKKGNFYPLSRWPFHLFFHSMILIYR